MAKLRVKSTDIPEPADADSALRLPAEKAYARELELLRAADADPRPEGWLMSPRAVLKYILGGEVGGAKIGPKYVGDSRLVEICIATLATDRALLLVGEPGTAKSWLSEHIAAAVSGDSMLAIQGTAGTTEEMVRYSWNYALLLAEGPSPRALVQSPVYRGMAEGRLVRFEEISRVPSEIQDAPITILSEKMMTVPELGFHISAKRGFSIIATANTRDKGVNDMSAALTRRFNKVMLPLPEDLDTEVAIVRRRVEEIGRGLRLPAPPPAEDAVRKIVQIFQELRNGQTLDKSQKVKPPSGVLSTAEAISLLGNSMSLAGHFGTGFVTDRDLAAALHGIVLQEEDRDTIVWTEYLENAIEKRGEEWRQLYVACKELL